MTGGTLHQISTTSFSVDATAYGDIPVRTRGETTDMNFFMQPNDAADDDITTRYGRILRLARHAGAYQAEQMQDNSTAYREKLPTDAAVPTTLLKIRPLETLPNRGGFWALLDSYSENTTKVLPSSVGRETSRSFSLGLLYLAETSNYSTRSDLESVFSGDVI
jgi:hypothetical protein